MSHEVETMAWAVTPPWHGLGNQVKQGSTVDEMLQASGLDWEVEKRPSYYQTREGFKPVADQYHLVRKTDEVVLTSVGRAYTPVQNREALEFFREFTEAGDMEMQTAGSLSNGRRIWALASLKDGFSLPGGDDVLGYLMFTNPHMAGFSLLTQFTPICVVCANTMAVALGSQGKTVGTNAYRHPHFTKFSAEKAKKVLGLAKSELVILKDLAGFLTQKRFNEINVRQYFAEVFEPNKTRANNDNTDWSRLLDLPRVRDAVRLLEDQPGSELVSRAGTWWGAYNVVTYMADHVLGRNADTRLTSSWYGEYRQFKVRAFDKALEYAKTA